MRTRWPVLVLAAVVAVGCSRAEEYPDGVVAEFGRECMSQPGATVERCACALDGIQREYALKAYLDLVAQIRAGQRGLPKKIVNIFQRCAKEDAKPTGGAGGGGAGGGGVGGGSAPAG